MKKLTTSVLAVVLTASFALVNAQKRDTARTQNIDEVIVTGALGIKKIADAVTSAQQVVSAEQLNQAGNSNAIQALTGKVAGLQINLNNSSVNSNSSIQLRGLRSISGNNDALVVIDNVISSASVLGTLPPDLIESINVIKGAQGAALYGADGVNGVILVSTKKGAKNKLSVSYDGTVDFESVAFVPKRQMKYGQGWDKARDQYENGAWGPAFDGTTTAYGVPLYDYNGDGFITLDGIGWDTGLPTTGDNPAAIVAPYIARPNEVKNFFTTGTTLSNSVTLNAGSEGKYVLLSMNNTKRDFVIDGDKSNKTSILFKAGAKVNKFTFDGGLNYIRTDFSQTTTMYDEGSNDSLYWALLQSAPDIPITSYKGISEESAYTYNIYYQNPYWRMKHVRQDYRRDYYSANLGLGYDINDNINVKYTANLQGTFAQNNSHRDAWSKAIYNGAAASQLKSVTSAIFLDNRTNFDYYGDFLLNFDYDLTSDLNLKLNVGHNYQEHRFQVMQNGGASLAIPGVYTMTNVTQPLSASALDNNTFRRNSHAVFANLDLAYKNFLFVNATGRNEWASQLPVDNQSYFYPSVGLSFIPTKAFNFGGDLVNYMKVSGNWTKVGNSNTVGWYDINKTTEVVAGYPFGGVNSYRNSMVQTDPNIRPEFITTSEINLDLGLLKDRIKISGSIYQQDTKDLITNQTTSSAAGINTKKINIAKMQSKGAEINLGLTPIKTSDFKWDINLGYSYNESIVQEVIAGVADEILLTPANATWGIYAQKGSVFPLIKVSKMQRDSQGRVIIDAANGNPLITGGLENAGSAVPKSIYNFSTNVSFKGFKLGAVADYRFGSKFIADVKSGLAFNGSLYDSGEVVRENGGFIMPNSVISDGAGGYTPNTTVYTGGTNYSKLLTYYSSTFSKYGENLLTDGQAFKIREISLSYTLPKDMIKQLGLEEITFGVHARNPFKKFADDNLDYADPETSNYSGNARGVASRTQYPSTKVYGATLNLKF